MNKYYRGGPSLAPRRIDVIINRKNGLVMPWRGIRGALVTGQPKPISTSERRKRIRRITVSGSHLGFVGTVEYRHVYSQSGGAQYCIGPSTNDDIMVVYAEAFERDADPEDFNLDAMIAHECGHQKLLRDSNVRAVFAKLPSEAFEEILASLVGSVLLGDTESARMLVWKATAELSSLGMSDEGAFLLVERLQRKLEQLL